MTVGEFDHLFRTAGPTRSVLREPWMDEALCAETAPELFFPETIEDERAAKRICAACPVIAECLAYALTNRLADGIYGAMTAKERGVVRDTRSKGVRAREDVSRLSGLGWSVDRIALELGMSVRQVQRWRSAA